MMVTAFDIAPDLEPDLEVDFSLTVDVSVDDGGATGLVSYLQILTTTKT